MAARGMAESISRTSIKEDGDTTLNCFGEGRSPTKCFLAGGSSKNLELVGGTEEREGEGGK
jgi:hypothetical protein